MNWKHINRFVPTETWHLLFFNVCWDNLSFINTKYPLKKKLQFEQQGSFCNMNTYHEILSLSVLPSYLAQPANYLKSHGIISLISFLFLFICFIAASCLKSLLSWYKNCNFNTFTPNSRVNIIFHPIKLQMVYSICMCVGGRLSTCQAYMVDNNLGQTHLSQSSICGANF